MNSAQCQNGITSSTASKHDIKKRDNTFKDMFTCILYTEVIARLLWKEFMRIPWEILVCIEFFGIYVAFS